MPGVDTFETALRRREDSNQVTFETETLSGGQTHDFIIDESDDKVSSVEFKPADETLASEGIILTIRPIPQFGSTDVNFRMFEDSDREDIDEALSITSISTADDPQTFQPGGGQGIEFQNQQAEEQWYIRLEENSGNDFSFICRIRWFSLSDD